MKINPAIPNVILKEWVRDQGLTAAEFGRRMGYKSLMPHYLLGSTPRREVTDNTIGRLIRSFGNDAIAVSLRLANALNDQNANDRKA